MLDTVEAKNCRAGIVIGHFNSLNFLELNLAAIRRYCPDVPILVSDDASNALTYKSPPASVETIRHALENVIRRFKADLIVAKRRLGHQRGDWTSIANGMLWAHDRRLDILFKLSQRCIVNTPEWPIRCARWMVDHDYDLLTPRIDVPRNSLTTFLLGIRLNSRTRPLRMTPSAPRINMERHIFTLARDLGLQIGEFDRSVYSILHRLISNESEFESLAAGFGDELRYDLPFYTGR